MSLAFLRAIEGGHRRPFVATAFDPAHTSTGITLSNSNRTASGGGFQNCAYCARQVPGNAVQTRYFEATFLALSSDPGHNYCWLMDIAAIPSGDVDHSQGAGYNYYDMAGGTAYVVGSTIKCCLKNGNVYWGLVGSGWGNGGNPDTGVGYVSSIPDSRLVTPGFGVLVVGTGNAPMAFNLGQTGWLDPPPLGAFGW